MKVTKSTFKATTLTIYQRSWETQELSTAEFPEVVTVCSGGQGWQHAPRLHVLPGQHVPPALEVRSLSELFDAPPPPLSPGDDVPTRLAAQHELHFEV